MRSGAVCEALEKRTLLSLFSVDIQWVNRGDDDGFDDVTWPAGTTAEDARNVVDAALAAWETVIADLNDSNNEDNIIEVDIEIDPENSGCGGSVAVNTVANADPLNGIPDDGEMTINMCDTDADGVSDWFVDMTPWEHSEFLGPIINAFAGAPQASSAAFGLSDLFSLVTIEMVHVLGISRDPDLNWPANIQPVAVGDPVDSPGQLWVYDAGGVQALYTSNNGGAGGDDTGVPLHVANPPTMVNVLNPTPKTYFGARDVGNASNAGIRRDLRYLPSLLAGRVLAEVYGYDIITHGRFPNVHIHAGADANVLIRGAGNGEVDGSGAPIFFPFQSGDSDDVITVSSGGGNLLVDVDLERHTPGTGVNNGTVFKRDIPLASVEAVQIAGFNGGFVSPFDEDGDDVIILDFSDENWLPQGGISVDGGTGYNTLVIMGPPGANIYTITGSQVTISGAFGAVGYTQVSELIVMAHPMSSNNIMTVVGTGGLQKLVVVGSDGHDDIVVLDTANALQELEISGLDGPDLIEIEDLGDNTKLTIDAGGGNDVIELTGTAGSLGLLPAGFALAVRIDGGGGADLLALQDFNHLADAFYNFDVDFSVNPAGEGRIVRDVSRFFFHSRVEDVLLSAGAGDDDFFIKGTPHGSDLTIFADGGDDEFFLGSGGASGVNDIFSRVTIFGGSGENKAVVDDRGDTGGDQVTVTERFVGAAPGDTFFGISGIFKGSLEYHELGDSTLLADLTIHMGSGSDIILVESTAVGTDTTIFGGRGNDQFTVTAPKDPSQQGQGKGNDRKPMDRRRNGTADEIKSLLFLDGQIGADKLLVIDTSDTTADTMTLDEDEIGRGPADTFLGSASAGIIYKQMVELRVFMGSGGNTALIEATNPGTKTFVKTGEGDDTLLIRNLAGVVNDIRSKLDIDGQDGHDVATVDDAAETAVSTLTVTPGQVLGDGTYFGAGGELTYTDWEKLEVKSGLAGDNIFVTGTSPGTETTLQTGGGIDLVTVEMAGKVDLVRSLLSVDGSSAGAVVGIINQADPTSDQVVITDNEVLGDGTFFGPGGSFGYVNLNQLNLVTGTSGDLINLQSTNAATIYLLGGGGGNDVFSVDSNGLMAGGTVDSIVSQVGLVGGLGAINFLVLGDADDATGDTVSISPTNPLSGTIGHGASDTFFGPGGRITYIGLQAVGVQTGNDADVINIGPAPSPIGTLFLINGNTPTFADPQPGDRLNLDLAGVALPKVTVNGFGAGQLSSGSHSGIFYQGIELVDEASGGHFDVVLDMNLPALGGNDGVEDRVEAASGRVGAQKTLNLQVNGPLAFAGVESAINSLTVFGSADPDTLVVLETNDGLPMLAGTSPFAHTNPDFNLEVAQGLTPAHAGIHYDGGPGAATDQYVLFFLTPQVVSIFPDPPPQVNPNSGVVNVDGAFSMSYDSLTPILIRAAGGELRVNARSLTTMTEMNLVDLGDGLVELSGDGGFETTVFSGFDLIVVRPPDGVPLRIGEGGTAHCVLIREDETLTVFGDDEVGVLEDERGVEVTCGGIRIFMEGIREVEVESERR